MLKKQRLTAMEGKHHDAKPRYTRKTRHPDPCPACDGTGEGSAGDCPCAECQRRPTYRDHQINPLT